MNRLVIIGAGGHARVAADIAKSKYDEIIFLDDNSKIDGISGPISDFEKYDESVFFVAIGNNKIREMLFEKVEAAGKEIISLISNQAIIGSNVMFDKGVIVMPGVVINTGTIICKGAIINTSSSVDHDCVIGEFSHISVGSHLAGTVKIGRRVMVGAGTVVINNLSITSDAIIGAGSTVLKDITEKGTYVGTPASVIRK